MDSMDSMDTKTVNDEPELEIKEKKSPSIAYAISFSSIVLMTFLAILASTSLYFQTVGRDYYTCDKMIISPFLQEANMYDSHIITGFPCMLKPFETSKNIRNSVICYKNNIFSCPENYTCAETMFVCETPNCLKYTDGLVCIAREAKCPIEKKCFYENLGFMGSQLMMTTNIEPFNIKQVNYVNSLMFYVWLPLFVLIMSSYICEYFLPSMMYAFRSLSYVETYIAVIVMGIVTFTNGIIALDMFPSSLNEFAYCSIISWHEEIIKGTDNTFLFFTFFSAGFAVIIIGLAIIPGLFILWKYTNYAMNNE